MATISVHMTRIAVLVLITSMASTACADIYSYTDETGATHFSNVPNNHRYSLFLKEQNKSHSQPSVPTKTARVTLNRENRERYHPLVQSAANIHAIDPSLLHAVILAESGYNPGALSPKGAIGLMQLMPETARRYGVSNPYDPTQNINGGARYLSDLLRIFNHDLNLVLAAYNAGENAVIRHHNSIPPYRETLAYVPKVLDYYHKFNTGGH